MSKHGGQYKQLNIEIIQAEQFRRVNQVQIEITSAELLFLLHLSAMTLTYRADWYPHFAPSFAHHSPVFYGPAVRSFLDT